MGKEKLAELREKLIRIREEEKKNRIPRLRGYFGNLKQFRTINDIPDIPSIDE